MTDNRTPAGGARPYRIAGLIVSLLAIAVLSVVLFLGLAALLAGGDALIMGGDHLKGVLARMLELGGLLQDPDGRRLDPVLFGVYSFSCLIYAAVILAILAAARWRGGRDWRGLIALTPFTPDRVYWMQAAGAVAYGLLAGILLLRFYPEAKNWFVMPSGGAALAAVFALAVIMAPLTEEMLFRGWLYTSLRAEFGSRAAIGASSALFALAHYERTLLYALAVLPVGILLGFIRERTGGIRATILLHAIYNGSALGLKLLMPD